MHRNDRVEFAELLTNVMAYYGKDATTFLLDIFWQGLLRFEFEDVKRALSLHAQDPDNGMYAPKVADLTRMLEGSKASQGMQAWAKVERAIKSVGRYQTVVFDDPLIHAVIDEMGGWSLLCVTGVDELPFRARDFERRYTAYRLQRITPPHPARLVGQHESDNFLLGHDRPVRPMLIGDPDKALKTLEIGTETTMLRITQAGDIAKGLVRALGDASKRGAA
jgi:hypothetical protein